MGPRSAKELLNALHHEPPARFLALLDEAHAAVARERRDLRLACEAVAAIAAEPLDAPLPSEAMTISALAGALGTTAATLRHWEVEGLLAADRAGRGRVRTFSPLQVRDARVVHQLRTAGYRIPHLRAVMRRLVDPGRPGDALEEALHVRDQQLVDRPYALLRAAAALSDVLALEKAPVRPDRLGADLARRRG